MHQYLNRYRNTSQCIAQLNYIQLGCKGNTKKKIDQHISLPCSLETWDKMDFNSPVCILSAFRASFNNGRGSLLIFFF